MATKSRNTRDLRWNLRVAEAEDTLVRAASEEAEESFTSFVRHAAVAEARRVLADRTRFELNETDWSRFTEALERPAEIPAGLAELFSKPSVFR